MDNEQNKNFFDRFSEWATHAAGSPSAFLIALILNYNMGRNWGPINKRVPDLKNDIIRPN